MTELTREQIERIRNEYDHEGLEEICDMALTKKDAEAECERLSYTIDQKNDVIGSLKSALVPAEENNARVREMIDYVKGLISKGETDQSVLLDALATPPPESERCEVCGGEGRRAFPNATNTMVHHPVCTACNGTGNAHPTPEQAVGNGRNPHYEGTFEGETEEQAQARRLTASTPKQTGDALAAFEEVMADFHELTGIDPNANPKVRQVRQALTASGVPYVPEEVRRLPERMDCQADARDDGDFISDHQRGVVDASRHWAKSLRQALASAPAVTEWVQPAWRPIDTYPRDQGVYRNGTRCWLWHEDLGVCWGFMDDLPSGFRCELFQKRRGTWEVVGTGVKAARKVRYWMPAAPKVPEPPLEAAPTHGGSEHD